MKKITQEEYEKLQIKGRGRSSRVFNEVLNLKPGEILKIEKADWKKRSGPSRVSSYIGKRYGRKLVCESVIGDSGWVVKRIS